MLELLGSILGNTGTKATGPPEGWSAMARTGSAIRSSTTVAILRRHFFPVSSYPLPEIEGTGFKSVPTLAVWSQDLSGLNHITN